MSQSLVEIRKLVVFVEETYSELDRRLEKPIKRAAAAAVIKNPYAGRYVENLQVLIDAGEYLGGLLGKAARSALGIAPEEVENYGKAAIVGEDGELEHGHAILHPKFGGPLRDECGGREVCKAIIPSSVKMGGVGTAIDVPLHYKRAAFVRTHYDAMEVRISDAPKRDEIVVIAALTSGGRPLPRIGGLKKEEVKGEDGLR
ncbi:MAG: amino acid synthesis family protein [Aigarchaeota archaeon]|nr:amino acid synthesis family protein [Candidatus Pelearchaeum maunauluense]